MIRLYPSVYTELLGTKYVRPWAQQGSGGARSRHCGCWVEGALGDWAVRLPQTL